jgi:hypothetical protein
MRAQVQFAANTKPAFATNREGRFGYNTVTNVQVINARTDRSNKAGTFMAYHNRRRKARTRIKALEVRLHVCATHPGGLHLEDHLARSR